MDGGMDGWTYGWMDGWMGRLSSQGTLGLGSLTTCPIKMHGSVFRIYVSLLFLID